MSSGILDQFVEAFTDPGALVGHFAYVLLIVSMMMRSMHWLRIFAIGAGTVSAIYYWTLGDYVSMFWESLFSLVNVVQLLIIAFENRRGRFTGEEELFISSCLHGLERAQSRRLVKLGVWTEVGAETVLITENTCPQYLKFIVEGTARIEHNDNTLGLVGRGDFLGEMSYLTGKQASATVVTNSKVRYLGFDREKLREHLSKNPDVRHALEASFNRNLVEKLVKTNEKVGVAPDQDLKIV